MQSERANRNLRCIQDDLVLHRMGVRSQADRRQAPWNTAIRTNFYYNRLEESHPRQPSGLPHRRLSAILCHNPTRSMAIKANRLHWHYLPIFLHGVIRHASALLHAATAVLGFLLVLAATVTYGAGVSTDSVNYLSAAENWSRGLGLMDHRGWPLLNWPPLYPVILGTIKLLTGLPLEPLGRYLNALVFAAVILLSAHLLGQVLPQHAAWRMWAVLALALSPSILALCANIGSDGVFILLVLLFLVASQGWLRNGLQRWQLLMAGIAAAAALVRWTGASLILAGSLWLLYAGKNRLRRALLEAMAFAVLASLPLAGWVFGRNYAHYGSLVGPRNLGEIDIFGNLRYTLEKVALWFLPQTVIDTLWLPALALLLLAALAVLARRDLRSRLLCLLRSPNLALYWIFLLAYLLFILATTFTGDHIDVYDDRYQAPLFVPLLVVLLACLRELLGNSGGRRRRWIYPLVTFLMAVWLIYPAFKVYKFVVMSRDQGVVYYDMFNNRRLRESDFVARLQSFPYKPDLVLYSNLPSAVYYYTGRITLPSPSDPQNYTASTKWLLENVESWPEEKRAYFIWMLRNDRRRYFSPNQIKKVSHLVLRYRDALGEIYEAGPKER